MTASFCDKATELARDGWDLRSILTGSNGLRVDDVRFRGSPWCEQLSIDRYPRTVGRQRIMLTARRSVDGSGRR